MSQKWGMNRLLVIPCFSQYSSSGRAARFWAYDTTSFDHRPAISGGMPPAAAMRVFWSIWLTVSNSTTMRSWDALKASTVSRMASPSNPVHFSQ